MSRFANARFSNARFATVLAVVLALLTSGIVAGAAGQALIIGGANDAGVSNTSLDTTSGGFAWQMYQHGNGVGVYAISDNGVALAALAHNGNQHGLSVTNDGAAGTGAAIIADGKNNTAADLRVNSSSIPPLKVNSTGLVANLNSDLVDGLHANALTRVAFNGRTDFALNGVDGVAISTTITAPIRGFLTITAGSDVFGGPDSFFSCNLDVDGTNINASTRSMSLATGNGEEDCSTNAGFATCGGTHTVSLEGSGLSAGVIFNETTIEVQFTPYDGAGNLRPFIGCLIIPFDEPGYSDENKAE